VYKFAHSVVINCGVGSHFYVRIYSCMRNFIAYNNMSVMNNVLGSLSKETVICFKSEN
jgi:hypothetical protein